MLIPFSQVACRPLSRKAWQYRNIDEACGGADSIVVLAPLGNANILVTSSCYHGLSSFSQCRLAVRKILCS